MAAFTIALRSLLRRKSRGVLIGLLVMLGTFILVFGTAFATSAKTYSKDAIIHYFTGDLLLYSERSKDVPSPFSFLTPLPLLDKVPEIQTWINKQFEVENSVAYTQNYGLITVKKDGKNTDLQFIFYAADPKRYKENFNNFKMLSGSFFGENGANTSGIVISKHQKEQYRNKYGIDLNPGDPVTLLSVGDGGSVNAVNSQVLGVFEPKHYANVFDYINFMDIDSYRKLYNFTGVQSGSLPKAFDDAMTAKTDDDFFALADKEGLGNLNTDKLQSQDITGFTMLSVRLKDHEKVDSFLADLKKQNFPIKTAYWYQGSDFFANVAGIVQSVIWGATFLIFVIVSFILMNTLIINILERTSEIGTLRAIGSEKGFVRAIFLWESLILNGVSAFVGMLVSFVVIVTVGSTGISLPEVMSQYLIGGGPLKVDLTPFPFLIGLAAVLALSFLATLYPISVATKITPLKAMSGT